MILRPVYEQAVHEALSDFPVAAILGPRQCGKTTLARLICKNSSHDYYDLEDPIDAARLASPMLALEKASELVVIDEIQRIPQLFNSLRVLADRDKRWSSYLVLGSASPSLVRDVSETPAGRVGFVHMSGFDLSEIGPDNYSRLWNRGGFPRSYLAGSDRGSFRWRRNFVQTFLERDLPQLGITVPARTLEKFWSMLAHYHGQVWNGSEFARSLGSSAKTATRYLDLLTDAYVIRQLQPWYVNIKKRQVKSPKVYLRDSGLLHVLLGLEEEKDILGHPKCGASWEGFVLEQIAHLGPFEQLYYWATHAGAELDVLCFFKGKKYGFEIKLADAPRMSRSMHIAKDNLGLDRLLIIYPGRKSYDLSSSVRVVSIMDLPGVLQAFKQ